jgi:ribonuclease HII
MPWIIGIDEAGYGPNLGPLVMTAVACRVPDELAGGNLWKALRPAVRRKAKADDDRFFIDDSKRVFSQTQGLHELEQAVLGAVRYAAPQADDAVPTLASLVRDWSPDSETELQGEPWYNGTTALPLESPIERIRRGAARFHRLCAKRQVAWGIVRSVIVCAPRFNELVDRWGSKGAVLGLAMTQLVRACQAPDQTAEPVAFVIDKHGGRNQYSALVQHALEEAVVLAREERAGCSHYEAVGLNRNVTITFRPRADSRNFCVALASMISKYLRETLMHEFNRFWQEKVPGVKPTAGYPGDAERFFDEIRPTVQRLGISEASLWRQR